MSEVNEQEKNALEGIQGLISSHIKPYNYNSDIVEIANESGLTFHIPSQLEQWRHGDFNYDYDVYQLLMKSFENEDKKTIEHFFQNIYDNIRKFQCCKRYQRSKCYLPKENDWNEEICEDCDNYIDNGLKSIFTKHMIALGFILDDEGFVHYNGLEISNIDQFVKEMVKETSKDMKEILPDDIIIKGKEMSEIYVLLYCIENSLRLFLETVFQNEYGEDFIDEINISSSIRNKITSRKKDEKKNKWLSIRGGNDLFYTDLDEISNIIQNNWTLLDKYFPNQNWIIGKIQEISKCRNLIAHNSYIKKDERDMIILYYKQIMKQI